MVKKTLTAMRLGGIWDHVGFGFHRYSTDAAWLLPHFEKMLYDQALIAMAYLETYQITRDPFFAQVAEEIFAYVLRDMTSPEGAFYTAEDADSEGQEGRFYVWGLDEFLGVVGRDGSGWARIFNLEPEGNFQDEASHRKTGANILHLDRTLGQWAQETGQKAQDIAAQWEAVRKRLFARRVKRVHPLKDDKVLTSWNGLMIAAFCMGARVLEAPAYRHAAQRAEGFLKAHLRDPGGSLFHRYREGETRIEAHADDYAFLVLGLLELYATTDDPKHLADAVSLQKRMLEDFWDDANGGFFLTATGSEPLPVRPKEVYDGALPSANSVSLFNLLRLSRLTGDPGWEEKASDLSRAFAGSIKRQPTAFAYFLLGYDFASLG